MDIDKLRVYVPDGNTNAAEIEINGERPKISRLEVVLEPDKDPTVRVDLCPDELEIAIDGDAELTLADDNNGHDPYNHGAVQGWKDRQYR